MPSTAGCPSCQSTSAICRDSPGRLGPCRPEGLTNPPWSISAWKCRLQTCSASARGADRRYECFHERVGSKILCLHGHRSALRTRPNYGGEIRNRWVSATLKRTHGHLPRKRHGGRANCRHLWSWWLGRSNLRCWPAREVRSPRRLHVDKAARRAVGRASPFGARAGARTPVSHDARDQRKMTESASVYASCRANSARQGRPASRIWAQRSGASCSNLLIGNQQDAKGHVPRRRRAARSNVPAHPSGQGRSRVLTEYV